MKKLDIPKELIQKLKTQSDVEELIGGIYKELIQTMLEGEMDGHLGYAKNERGKKETNNHRNGKSGKTIKTSSGTIDIEVPRDREASFEPIIVPKHERVSTKIEQAIISFYAKGLTVRDIEEQIEEMYGVRLSPASISAITDKVLDHVKEWQSRPLERVYFVLWVDGLVFKVRQNGKVINKTVYVVIGLSNKGYKEVLGLWISESESASFWMHVFGDLQSRGVEDVLLICSDNLTGLTEGIKAIFPKTDNQICIVHQIRNAMRYVAWKDRKAFASDMKAIYQATTIESAEQGLKSMDEKWGKKYPHAIQSWRNNWTELMTFYDYPVAIRRIIYTTNVIESFNSMVRRQSSKRTIFPSDDAVFKSIYLALIKINKKWEKTIWNWGIIANQFLVKFGERTKL